MNQSEEKIRYGFTLLAITVGVFCFGYFAGKHIDRDWSRFSIFNSVQTFGENCELAEGVWKKNLTFKTALNQSYAFKKTSMPYRSNPAEQKPHPEEGQYTVTRCNVNLNTLKKEQYSIIRLGPLYGKSAVFINQRLALIQDDNSVAEIQLSPQERQSESVVTIISRRTNQASPITGLATNYPLFISDQKNAVSRIDNLTYSMGTERPLFIMLLALTLAVGFSTLWILGIRYADVSWIIIFLVSTALSYAFLYRDSGSLESLQIELSHTFSFLKDLSLVAFAISFLRLSLFRYKTAVIIISTILYPYLSQVVPPGLKSLLNYHGSFSSLLAGFLLIYICWAGRPSENQKSENSEERKWRYRFGWIVFTAIGLYMISTPLIFGLSMVSTDFPFDTVFMLLIICFPAINLFTDLAAFQRSYFISEKSKTNKENENAELLGSLHTARQLQDKLFDHTLRKESEHLDCTIKLHSTQILTNNWYFHYQTQNKQIFILGEVNGSGPATSMAIAAIISSLEHSKNDQENLATALTKSNQVLFNLFDGYKTSKVSAISIDGGGDVEVICCASSGIQDLTHNKQVGGLDSSKPLGQSAILELKIEEITIVNSCTLLAFTQNLNSNQIDFDSSDVEKIFTQLSHSAKPDQDWAIMILKIKKS